MSRMLSEGLIHNYAFFAALPAAAREAAKETLEDIAADVLALQQSLVPVYSGRERKDVTPGLLKDALNIAEAIQYLRVRIGLPQLKGKRSKLFYAIFVEYGRQAKTVAMRRLKRGARKEWNARARAGTARRSAKPADLLDAARTMRVGAIAPRPFVHVEDRFQQVIDAGIDGFWDKMKVAQ